MRSSAGAGGGGTIFSSSPILWVIPTFTTLSLFISLLLRTRRRAIIKKHPNYSLSLSPRISVRELSDNIVAIESSDKGALIPHPRRQRFKNDFIGGCTMQRKVLLVMVGEWVGNREVVIKRKRKHKMIAR